MCIIKEFLIKTCLRSDGNINIRCANKEWWHKRNYLKEYDYIFNRSKEYNLTIPQTIRFIINDYNINCPKCGNRKKQPENMYCSAKCAANTISTLEKRKRTNIEKYGKEYVSQVKEFREKIDNYRGKRYKISKEAQDYLNNKNVLISLHHDKKMTVIDICNHFNNKFDTTLHYSVIKEVILENNIELLYHKPNNSSVEREIREYICTCYDNVCYNLKLPFLNNKELDIFIPDAKIAIEVDGLYWHSDIFKDKNYHNDKTNICKQNGIKLYHIFDSEWLDNRKQNIWKSILNPNKVVIYARQCSIKKISESCKDFLDNNHIQGYTPSSINYGLYYNDMLVSIMTFGKSRYNKGFEYELLRFCTVKNYRVIGGASKLLKAFNVDYNYPSLISYSDRRYSYGNVYSALGFEYSHTTSPNYWYWNKKRGEYILENRLNYQKHKLKDKLDNYDHRLTEYENMQNNGYCRIYDCGNDVWIMNKKS